MSTGRKLFVAGAVALVLLSLVLFWTLRGQRERAAPQVPISAAREETHARREETKSEEPPAAAAPAVVAKAPDAPHATPPAVGRTLRGRLIRAGESAGAPAAPTPAAEAAVKLTWDPRRENPDSGPPALSVKAATDGSFELRGISNHAYWILDLDDPSSAILSFTLRLPKEKQGVTDLGDFFLEPATPDLPIRLVGPDAAPVEKGWIVAGRNRRERGPQEALGLSERRRQADERGGGSYVLTRPQRGNYSLQVMAPGCAPLGLDSVSLPREEPLVIELEKGLRIAGAVLSAEGKAMEGVALRVSGRNLFRLLDAKSGDGGRFVFDGLKDGEYTLQAEAEGYAIAYLEGVPGGTEDQEIRLSKEAIFAGEVVDDESGSPVPEAVVVLNGEKLGPGGKAETDQRGKLEIRKLPAGSYHALVQHPKFKDLRADGIELAAGQRLEGQVFRLNAGLTAIVKVLDAGTDEPVSGARVNLHRQEAGGGLARPVMGVTEPDGVARLSGLEAGSYRLLVSAEGFLSPEQETPIELAEGEALEETLRLEKGASISGRVIDGKGAAVTGAEVYALLPDMRPGRFNMRSLRGSTNAEGRFLIEGLAPHPGYAVRATHSLYAPTVVRDIAVERGQATEGLELRLSAGGTIRGQVLDSKGRGVSQARLNVKHAEDSEVELAARMVQARNDGAEADEDGRYSLPRLRPGAYELTAGAEGFEPATRQDIVLAQGQVLEGVDLVLESGRTWTGRVVDTSGRPVAGATLRWAGVSARAAPKETDDEGRFRLQSSGGQARVFVEKAGFAPGFFELAEEETTLTLLGTGKVSGQVRARGRETFPSFSVDGEFVQAGQPPRAAAVHEASVKPDGRFDAQVSEGNIVLRVMVPGFAPGRSAPLQVRAGEAIEGVVIDLVQGGIIEGVVVVKGSGEPVGNAWVHVQPMGSSSPEAAGMVQSSSNGKFKIEGLREGLLELSVQAPGHAPFKLGSIQVRPGETLPVKVELDAGLVVTGRITSKGSTVRAEGLFANAVDGAAGHGEGTVDENGEYSLRLPGPGRYSVGVRLGRRAWAQLEITVPPGVKTLRQDLELAQGRIRGVVLDAATSRPLSGAPVLLIPNGAAPGQQFSETCDRQGRFTFSNLAQGIYRLHAVAEGHAEGRLEGIETSEGEPGDVRVALEIGVELTAHVLDPEGRPPPGIFPILRNAKGESVLTFTSGEFSQSGKHRLGNLLPGSYRLSIFSPPLAPAHRELRVENEPVSITIRMQAGAEATIVVQDAGGRPLAGAAVEVVDESGASMVEESRGPYFQTGAPPPPALTDSQGRFKLNERLRPGVYRAFAKKGGARTADETINARNGERAEVILRFPE